jgi:hypothetical protein
MTRWLLLVVVLGIATVPDHSIAAETTLWQSSCNPWMAADDNWSDEVKFG